MLSFLVTARRRLYIMRLIQKRFFYRRRVLRFIDKPNGSALARLGIMMPASEGRRPSVRRARFPASLMPFGRGLFAVAERT